MLRLLIFYKKVQILNIEKEAQLLAKQSRLVLVYGQDEGMVSIFVNRLSHYFAGSIEVGSCISKLQYQDL